MNLLTKFLKLSADKIFPPKNLCIVKNNLGFFFVVELTEK